MPRKGGWAGTHNVGCNYLAVEVDAHASKSKPYTQPLRQTSQETLLQSCRDGVAGQYASCRVQADADMVLEQVLNEFLARLLIVGNVFKC